MFMSALHPLSQGRNELEVRYVLPKASRLAGLGRSFARGVARESGLSLVNFGKQPHTPKVKMNKVAKGVVQNLICLPCVCVPILLKSEPFRTTQNLLSFLKPQLMDSPDAQFYPGFERPGSDSEIIE
jgi:hypothetical protein